LCYGYPVGPGALIQSSIHEDTALGSGRKRLGAGYCLRVDWLLWSCLDYLPAHEARTE
jgi:hypothetical protein